MKSIKPKDIQRSWHLVDAKNKILGRISSEIATLLMGKNKAYYVPNLDTGDYVVVVNAGKIVLSGRKETQKKYYRHSGYPGGLYMKTAKQLRAQKPELLLRHAIVGMLPKTAMGKQMLKKLYVFTEKDNPFAHRFARPKGSGNSANTKTVPDSSKTV